MRAIENIQRNQNKKILRKKKFKIINLIYNNKWGKQIFQLNRILKKLEKCLSNQEKNLKIILKNRWMKL